MKRALRPVARIALCAMALSPLAVPAAAAQGAATDDEPVTVAFADPEGDANLVNDQGLDELPVDDAGPDTRPASLGSADLVEAWYETTYTSVPEHGTAGEIVRIRHVPTGLRLHLRTADPPVPSFGPTVSHELWVSVATCPIILRWRAHGPLSLPDDPPQGPELRTRSSVCHEGAKSYTEGISLEVEGSVAVLEVPFAVLDTPAGWLLRPGDTIDADPDGRQAHTTTLHGLPDGPLLGGPNIDQATVVPGFVIGSDVPPDVDCVASPEHEECVSASADGGAGVAR